MLVTVALANKTAHRVGRCSPAEEFIELRLSHPNRKIACALGATHTGHWVAEVRLETGIATSSLTFGLYCAIFHDVSA
jgi:hypothetical protein